MLVGFKTFAILINLVQCDVHALASGFGYEYLIWYASFMLSDRKKTNARLPQSQEHYLVIGYISMENSGFLNLG